MSRWLSYIIEGIQKSEVRNQKSEIRSQKVAKVEFDIGIDSVRGILMGSDPFYIRRYPDRGGGVMHIVQARPNRSGHVASAAERQNRIDFAEKYGAQRHAEFMERKWRGQLEIPFESGQME